ncbi:MAG TPA: FtsX-like permease family protein, partial [Acidimicrobiales bacterium]|nr:FtsX-like permease family protein [Acidimicrobiales bacterium]
NTDLLLLGPAFWTVHGDDVGGFDNLVLVRSRPGADLDVLASDIRQLWSDDPELFVGEVAPLTGSLRQLMRMQATALGIVAAAIGTAGLVVVGQALRRSTSGDDDHVFAALGLTRAQRVVVVSVPLAVAVALGAVVAIFLALVASAAFPMGEVATVDPDPGVRRDTTLLLGGGALVTLAGVAAAAVAAVRATSPDRATTPARIARTARLVSRGPVAVSVAGHLATRRGVPARPAVLGAVVALAGAVAAVTFDASLERVLNDPVQDGWAWDAEVGLADGLTDNEALASAREVAARAGITGVALARLAQLPVAGDEVQIVGIEEVEGSIGLLALSGTTPRRANEVALGPATAEVTGAVVGDTVSLGRPGHPPGTYEVTGLVRFPNLADDTPARGVAMTLEGLATVLPPGQHGDPPGFPTLFVRWAPGADLAALTADLAEEHQFVEGPRHSSQMTNLGQVRPLGPALVAVLSLLGLAAVMHALLLSIRGAERDLAILAAIGFDRRQRFQVVIAQSAGYLVAGLGLGLPLGIAAGRLVWRLLAGSLALIDAPVVPLSVGLVVPVATAAAISVALLPAIRAARLTPATHLRTE